MEQRAETLRLGGMALRNGLLVHGPTHWAAAVRAADGSISVASGRKPRATGFVLSIPGARGVIRLGEAMAVIPLVKRALPEAQLPFQNAPVLGVMAGAAVAGSVLRRRAGGVRGEVAAAAVSLVPSLVALRGGDLAAYHGVEHKAIAAYEHGDQDAADAAKEHDRCGSGAWPCATDCWFMARRTGPRRCATTPARSSSPRAASRAWRRPTACRDSAAWCASARRSR